MAKSSIKMIALLPHLLQLALKMQILRCSHMFWMAVLLGSFTLASLLETQWQCNNAVHASPRLECSEWARRHAKQNLCLQRKLGHKHGSLQDPSENYRHTLQVLNGTEKKELKIIGYSLRCHQTSTNKKKSFWMGVAVTKPPGEDLLGE